MIPLLLILLMSCGRENSMRSPKPKQDLRINEIQVIGSHNSYKTAIEPALMSMLMKEDSTTFFALNYSHVNLERQLDLGLRKLELDIVHDPEGGRFASPLGLSLLRQQGIEPQSYDPDSLMYAPGFKVLHVQDLDFRSNCLRLKDCLQEIKTWSDSHPDHIPIAISFNAKTDVIDRPGFVRPLGFGTAAFDSLDAEIKSIIHEDRIIKPDDIRGGYATLEEAALAGNWPKLEESRGKFLFVLDEGPEKRAAYLKGHPNLLGRVMFIDADPGDPAAAFIIFNDPIKHLDSIQSLVKMGYMVRTRADANTLEARVGDLARLQAALKSGAQFISTDYYLDENPFGTRYKAELPNKQNWILNPVLYAN